MKIPSISRRPPFGSQDNNGQARWSSKSCNPLHHVGFLRCQPFIDSTESFVANNASAILLKAFAP
jgi:hypothetical protein